MNSFASNNLPTTVVIFGASGDLTRRKLVPALFNEHQKGRTPKEFSIVGSARTEFTHDDFRQRLHQGLVELAGMEQEEKELPFQTLLKDKVRYKVFGIVTNMDWAGQELIEWHYKRCGRSEQAHSVMKEDLAGGTLPSGDFGENAAWWWIMILAFNLNAAFKSLVLGGKWVWKRMKAMRFYLINIPARVIGRSRQLSLRLNAGDPAYGWLVSIRAKIAGLLPAP